MNNRHRATWDWLQKCPHIQDLFFNAAQAGDGNTQLFPSEDVLETYLDGSSLRRYKCALTRFMEISFDPNDLSNIQDAVDMDRLGEWIEEQNERRNFPEFPDGCAINEITVDANESGYLAMLDAGIAKYMLQFNIEYVKG